MAYSKKKQVIVCSWATGVGAGVGRMESYYARFLNPELYEVTFVYPGRPEQHGKQYGQATHYVYLGDPPYLKKLADVLRRADIVQFQGGFDPLTCEAARLVAVPALVEVIHNVEPGQAFPWIDLTVCVSESVGRLQPDKARCVSILNGIDLKEFSFREQRRDDKIILLQVSNRSKCYFNLDDIQDELLRIDDRIELWLAGPNQSFPSSERVKFFGVVENVVELYQQAHFMVLISKEEPFGLAAIEAMATGCLPIVTNEGGFTEIITHGQDGWLVSPDKDALLTQLTSILQDSTVECLASLRANARKKVEESFSIEKCITQYEEAYDRVLVGKEKCVEESAVEGTCESDIGEALVFSQRREWEGVEDAMHQLVLRETNLIHGQSAAVAGLFARNIHLRGNGDLARRIYCKIFDSGFATEEVISYWIPCSISADFVAISASLCTAAENRDLVASYLERLIELREVKKALQMLQRLHVLPLSEETKAFYAAVSEKLHSIIRKQAGLSQ